MSTAEAITLGLCLGAFVSGIIVALFMRRTQEELDILSRYYGGAGEDQE
jgi:hypothetical protein